MPWPLGPADGRYVMRGHAGEPAHVLVLRTLTAPVGRRRSGRRRSAQVAPSPAAATATATRATIIGATPLTEPGAAWLEQADLEAETAAALAVLDSVVHLHRTAAADPRVPGIARGQMLAVRVGYGAGEEVAEGRWTDAVAIPPPRPSRRDRSGVLRPQERLAAILGGRDVALACEELTLRVRADVDAGRWREAAFGLRVALEAAIAELEPWGGRGDVSDRIDELRRERGAIGDAANAALGGGLDESAIAAVEHALTRLEAALRARTLAELG